MNNDTTNYAIKSLKINARNTLKRRHSLAKKIERAEKKLERLKWKRGAGSYKQAHIMARKIITKTKLDGLHIELNFLDEKLEAISKGLKLLQSQ